MTGPDRAGLRLTGGIVAFGEGPRVSRSILSLLGQELPPGTVWERVWVVVAPDSVGTLAAARAVASAHPEVTVVAEADRRGKSAAIAEVFARAGGDRLVLLNGDAEARPGSVRALLRASEGAREPFGVMGRPVVGASRGGLLGEALALLWEVHHRVHLALFASDSANHLSDEILLLSVGRLPPLGRGVINDGAFAGAWIRRQGGALRYAPTAQVLISVPVRVEDHFRQRRRILAGHRQVERSLGLSPSTLAEYARRDPVGAVRLLWREARSRRRGLLALSLLVTVELGALVASRGRWRRPRHDPAVWRRVVTELPEVPRGGPDPQGAAG